MIVLATDYGPFAPVVGYAGAIIASGTALFALWGGKAKNWRPPNDALPGTEKKLVFLLCGVFMVVEWYFAEPQRVAEMIGAVSLMAILTAVFYLRYGSIIGVYGYSKPVPGGNGQNRELILGGRTLLPAAQQKRDSLGIDTQALLEGAQFKADLLWDRHDTQRVRNSAIMYFVLLLVMGTSALTTASFATQVILTKRSAASVIHKDEAPGLNKP